ncbi:MAG: hypothetical protein ACRDCE_12890 [Cetobacterium sp.]|uniref:hypothetical protein n=1 Tax=Cetobacterium sp. TaxID=2071632 RepID=UPI003EE5DE3B
MKNKKTKDFILKYALPSLVLELLFILYYYLKYGDITPFNYAHILLYFLIMFGVSAFWAFLWYLQDTVGIVMKSNLIGKIVFILIALGVIYIYKSTGKI